MARDNLGGGAPCALAGKPESSEAAQGPAALTITDARIVKVVLVTRSST
jgi:hypothetical protein